MTWRYGTRFDTEDGEFRLVEVYDLDGEAAYGNAFHFASTTVKSLAELLRAAADDVEKFESEDKGKLYEPSDK